MNDIISRLRDATRVVGETIDHAPVLEAGKSRTRRAWLAPVAAAASVMVAVAGGAVLAKSSGNGINQVAAMSAGPAEAPKFLADARGDGITIRSIDGGAETASLPDPSSRERFVTIQAAQDNRLFYAASATEDCHPRLYQFTLDDDGKIGSFGVLPFTPPEGTTPTSLAVSGDGSKIAYGIEPCDGKKSTGRLVVTETATGDSRTWNTTGDFGLRDVSMSADGRYVAWRRSGLISALGWATDDPLPTSSDEAVAPPDLVPSESAGHGTPAPLPSYEATHTDAATGTVTVEGGGTSEVPSSGTEAEPSPAASASTTPDPASTRTKNSEPGAIATVVASTEASPEGVPGSPLPSGGADPSTGAGGEPSRPAASADCAITMYEGKAIPTGQVADATPAETPSPAPSVAPSGAVGSVVLCMDSSEVSLLDTTASGDSLDQARLITLPTSYDGISLFGVRISPDGTRLIASLGSIGIPAVDANGKSKPKGGSSALIAYGTEDGKPIDVLYQNAGKGAMELLDLDGTGQHAIVQIGGAIGWALGRDSGGEIGEVDGTGYRTLLKLESANSPLIYPEVAW